MRRRIPTLPGWVVYVACFLAIGYSAYAGSHSLNAIEREGFNRRSETCYSFESAHKEEIKNLVSTYAYLKALSKTERRATLTKFVIKSLPGLEKDAASDQDQLGVFVPRSCDAPNVGLPEPDPVPPRRPADLARIIAR